MTTTAPETTTTITLTASAAHLAEQIGWIARMLPTRPAIPVLTGLRLEATADRVRVSGTDYEVWASADLDTDTTGEGMTVLPGRLLAGLLTKLPPSRMVTITIAPDQARIDCGPTRCTLRTLPAEDYPAPPEPPTAVGQTDAAELSAAVDQVVVAASTDPTLPMLTGVRTTLTETGIVLTATDRYRVAQQRVAWEPTLDHDQDENAEAPTLLVPAVTLSQAAKAMTGTVTLGIETGQQGRVDQFSLSDATRRLSTRLLDGDFPATAPFLERTRSDAQVTVTVETAELAAAIGRVRLFAADSTPIRITIEEEGLVVRAGVDGEEGSEDVPATVDGPGLPIAFNPGLLLDAVTGARAERVRLAIAETERPVLCTPDLGGDAYEHLIMPIRLGAARAA
ncbi:DNA polymerase III subunit beta [Nocardiopsis sp. NPDC049922]|uniref:DNA polymerase III subunit beta n=1 Tax=Nocardiopsis sp. NPDC049922 TaxID=3155157 RepID=UPI00340A68DC